MSLAGEVLIDPLEARAPVGGGQRRRGVGRRLTLRLGARARRQQSDQRESEASASCVGAAKIHVCTMPSKSTVRKAKHDMAVGKRPSTAAGEFVREEIEHIRQGKHGARSSKQAIAIGLSEARRAGVPLKPPAPGRTSSRTRRSATLAYEEGQGRRKPRAPSGRRGRATERALRREGQTAASSRSLAAQAQDAASRRSGASRSAAAKRAAATKGARGRSMAAKRAAATRKRNRG